MLHMNPTPMACMQACLQCRGAILFTGVGKSGFIAQKIAQTLVSTGTKAFALNPTDALHGDLGILGRGDLVVTVSKSGSTEELLRLVPFAKVCCPGRCFRLHKSTAAWSCRYRWQHLSGSRVYSIVCRCEAHSGRGHRSQGELVLGWSKRAMVGSVWEQATPACGSELAMTGAQQQHQRSVEYQMDRLSPPT